MTETVDRAPDPTSHDELVALLRGKQWQAKEQIRKDLFAQVADEDRAWSIFNNAEDQVRYEDTITRLRGELREALDAAENGLRRVNQVLDELCGDELYDTEYTESGHHVSDMREFLSDAARMVRAASALNPCPAGTAVSA
jgi:hypothetical protein